jgi:hypothetical protein
LTAKFQSDLAPLLAVATDRERIAIEAVIAHGSGPAACEAAGLTTRQLHNRLATARRRLQRENLGAAAPPTGFVPTAIATGPNGEVRSVRSRAEGAEEHLPLQPEGFQLKFISTLTNAAGEVSAQWARAEPEKVAQWQAYVEAIKEQASYLTPALPSSAPASVDEEIITCLPWGDPHIGLLSWSSETGENWDLKRAEEATAQVMADLISRTPRSSQFRLIDLGDLFDAEDDKQVTPTAGHKLDVDSRSGKIARVAVRIFRNTIDLALQRHGRVHVNLLRGNHDPYKSLMLGLLLEAIYANEPRVKVEPFENPYQFFTFGQNAVMLHHGDGSKPQQMPGIFSCDPTWSVAKSAETRYVFTGHIHSQNRWDLPGCSVESFRTIAASNYWAHHKGYRSKRTLDCITLHATQGEISRVQQGLRAR